MQKGYKEKRHLYGHIKSVHEGLREHECEDCDKTFFSKNDLSIHIDSVHKQIRKYINVTVVP